jgi:hypothetical protein
MTGISIEEIREALQTAADEAEAVDSAVNDVKNAASDIRDATQSVEDAAYESLKSIKSALSMLDGLAEDQAERIEPEQVEAFLQNTVSIIDRMSEFLLSLRGNVFAFARQVEVELKEE